MQKQEKALLIEAKDEIKALRITNQHMATRLQMFDDIMSLFGAQRNVGGLCRGMGEDLLWKIEKAIEADGQPETSADAPPPPREMSLSDIHRGHI